MFGQKNNFYEIDIESIPRDGLIHAVDVLMPPDFKTHGQVLDANLVKLQELGVEIIEVSQFSGDTVRRFMIIYRAPNA